MAETEYKKLLDSDCGEKAKHRLQLINLIGILNDKHDDATLAQHREQLVEACNLFREIEAEVETNSELKPFYPRLLEELDGCPPKQATPPNTLKADYDKAIELIDNNRHREALRLLKRIREKDDSYKDVNSRIREEQSKLQEEQSKLQEEQRKRKDQRLSDLKEEIKSLFVRGLYFEAQQQMENARELQASDPELAEIDQNIVDAIKNEGDELADAIDLFYSGKYADAQNQLKSFIENPHSPKIKALARFYQAAAMSGEYFLAGTENSGEKDVALTVFAQTTTDDPGFVPPLELVSPKIRDLFTEATNKNQDNKVK